MQENEAKKCPHCGCELLDILIIDERDERFSFLGLDGIITAGYDNGLCGRNFVYGDLS